MNIYEKLKSEISLDNIYKDMAFLIDEVGERLSGSEEMTKATEYLYKRLNENIGNGRIDHFPMYMSSPRGDFESYISLRKGHSGSSSVSY